MRSLYYGVGDRQIERQATVCFGQGERVAETELNYAKMKSIHLFQNAISPLRLGRF